MAYGHNRKIEIERERERVYTKILQLYVCNYIIEYSSTYEVYRILISRISSVHSQTITYLNS